MSYKTHTAKELIDRKVSKLPMLWEDIFPKVGLAALAGSSDTGKSSLLRQFAIAICNGDSNFLGKQIYHKRKSVVYISTEDDSDALAYLLGKQLSFSNNNMDRLFFIPDIIEDKDFKQLAEHLKKYPCDLIIIDSVSDMVGGDMNNQAIVRAFLNKYKRIAESHKCLILFLHHLNKRSNGGSKHQLNGSQAFEAKMRTVVILGKKDGYNNLERTLQVVKGNYTPSEVKKKTTILVFDENTLSFSKTGETICTSTQLKNDQTEKKIKDAIIKHHKTGLSSRKISEIVSEEVGKVGKSKVADIIREHKL